MNLFDYDENKLNGFSILVKDTFVIKQGLVVIGCVESGTLYQGDFVIVNGNNDYIAAIESNGKILKVADEGMSISILLKNTAKTDVEPGDIIYSD